MEIVAKTSVGKVRECNQDDLSYGKLGERDSYMVVCDGMGGAAGGEVASGLAVSTITSQIKSAYRVGMTSRSVKNMLTSAISAANAAVFDKATTTEGLKGMGTTVVCAVVVENVAHIAYAGDSRAYLVSDGDVNQLTRDHTFLQELFDLGKISKKQMDRDARKHIITRAVGVNESVSLDYLEQSLTKGDVLLLCTDGLTNLVDDEEILTTLEDTGFETLANRLVSAANEYGGTDNVTVVAALCKED